MKDRKLLAYILCAVFIASAAGVGEAGLKKDDYHYTIDIPGSTVEGTVVDNETDEPVAGAAVTVRINGVSFGATTDDSGDFSLSILGENLGTYDMGVSAVGYDPLAVAGKGGSDIGEIRVNYHPFDVELAENTGSLARGYTSTTGRRAEPFTTQRTVPVLDNQGKQVYDVVEENVVYTWEEEVTTQVTETVALGADAGEWKDTGETFTESWGGGKPDLPGGYRWVETSRGYTFGVWTTTTFKKQHSSLQEYMSKRYTIVEYKRQTTSTKVERYNEWVPGYYEDYKEWVKDYEDVYGWGEWKYSTDTSRRVSKADYDKWNTGTTYSNYQHGDYATKAVKYKCSGPNVYVTGTMTFTRSWAKTGVRETGGHWETKQRWVEGRWEQREREVTVTEMRVTGYSATRQVQGTAWQEKSSGSRPEFYLSGTDVRRRAGSSRSGTDPLVRNMKAISSRRLVPRTAVENYTAYRVYESPGASPLPWGEKRTEVVVTPRNGYTGGARLEVVAGDGVDASVESSELRFSSVARTNLKMTPRHASTHTVTVRGLDANGRLVGSRAYQLEATEAVPGGAGERLVTTIGLADNMPAAVTITTRRDVAPGLDSNLNVGGPVYDGGSVGTGMTLAYTVDCMNPLRVDGTVNYTSETTWRAVYGSNNIIDWTSLGLG